MRDFHLPGRSAVYAGNGLCATSHTLAAETAIDILKRGGNAMDAAIAGAVLLGICEPHMTGIGGDCFVLWSHGDGDKVHALNGSGRAPAALNADLLRGGGHTEMPEKGVHTVTLPGAMDAFCHLSERVGRIGLDAILAPTIHYADAGVPVAPRAAFDWAGCAEDLKEHGRSHYLIDGRAPAVGTMFRSPGQAEVLRQVAAKGRSGFYEGEVMEDMLDTLKGLGGTHTAEDFHAVACDPGDPVSTSYKGLEILEHPPNGQGATALLMLNMLGHFDLAELDPMGAERAHIEAEVAKLAYDARNRFIADPDHTTRLDHMLDPDTARKLAALVDPGRAMPSANALSGSVHKDTVYITVVDKDRMAVSLIYSIFHSFGSGYASEKYGILFQNRGAGFCLEPGHPNELGPGKRPMHTIIPGMTRQQGRVMMPFGVMGGQYQPQGHARFTSNLVDFGMDLQAALDAPRVFADRDMLKVERGYGPSVHQALSDLGHKVVVPPTPVGGAQAIRMLENGVLEGASDPRKDGCALGY